MKLLVLFLFAQAMAKPMPQWDPIPGMPYNVKIADQKMRYMVPLDDADTPILGPEDIDDMMLEAHDLTPAEQAIADWIWVPSLSGITESLANAVKSIGDMTKSGFDKVGLSKVGDQFQRIANKIHDVTKNDMIRIGEALNTFAAKMKEEAMKAGGKMDGVWREEVEKIGETLGEVTNDLMRGLRKAGGELKEELTKDELGRIADALGRVGGNMVEKLEELGFGQIGDAIKKIGKSMKEKIEEEEKKLTGYSQPEIMSLDDMTSQMSEGKISFDDLLNMSDEEMMNPENQGWKEGLEKIKVCLEKVCMVFAKVGEALGKIGEFLNSPLGGLIAENLANWIIPNLPEMSDDGSTEAKIVRSVIDIPKRIAINLAKGTKDPALEEKDTVELVELVGTLIDEIKASAENLMKKADTNEAITAKDVMRNALRVLLTSVDAFHRTDFAKVYFEENPHQKTNLIVLATTLTVVHEGLTDVEKMMKP